MTDADFNGAYIMSQLLFDPNPMSKLIRITADGSTISTSSDGTITTGGGMMGQLSWDGALFAFPDADSVSDFYLFTVGIRKP